MAILALLAALGLVAWIVQLSQGMQVTGINQAVVWGFYIGTFFLLAGTASGLLFLAALGHLEIMPGLNKYRRDILIGAVAAYLGAGTVILMDIGHPERVLQFLTSPQFGSPFVWDFYALALATVVALAYLVLAPQARWLAWVAGIVSLGVVLAEGLLMSVSGARPVWHSPLIPVLFLVEALVSSAAILYLAIREEKVEHAMVKMLRVCLPILLILSLVEAITVMYGGETETKQAMSLILTGKLAWLFWLQIVLGIVVPLAIFAMSPPGRVVAAGAAILAILGVLVAKLNVLIAGQAFPRLDQPTYYTPTWVETAGVFGVIAFAILLFTLGRRLLPSKT